MRKHIVALLFLAMAGILVCSLAIAGPNPGTGITQTSHDLTSATGKGALWDAGVNADPELDRLCIYCHAPHHTITTAEAQAAVLNYYPLWNHDLSTIALGGYTMYSNTYDGTEPDSIQHKLNADLSGQPGGISKLCLSCHDGTVAVSSYGNFAGGVASSKHTGAQKITGRFLIGLGTGNLQNHHPIGFDYGAVAAMDDEIKDTGSVLLGNNPWGLTVNDLLWGGKMECSSCHDVHNTKNSGIKFTWVQDTNSNLCFSCHKK